MDISPREVEPFEWLAWPLAELDDDERVLIFVYKVGQRQSKRNEKLKS